VEELESLVSQLAGSFVALDSGPEFVIRFLGKFGLGIVDFAQEDGLC
jgi:hypothetical protein